MGRFKTGYKQTGHNLNKEGIADFLRQHLGVITEIKMIQRINECIYILQLSNWEETERYREQKKLKGF